MKNYYKHKTLPFVVDVKSEYTINIGSEWIKAFHEPLHVMEGVVVYDPHEIWGVGKESKHWSPEALEQMQSKYIIEVVNGDVPYWTATDIETGYEHAGGWYETGSFKNRDYKIHIEWDTECPEDYEVIEEEIISKVE